MEKDQYMVRANRADDRVRPDEGPMTRTEALALAKKLADDGYQVSIYGSEGLALERHFSNYTGSDTADEENDDEI